MQVDSKDDIDFYKREFKKINNELTSLHKLIVKHSPKNTFLFHWTDSAKVFITRMQERTKCLYE